MGQYQVTGPDGGEYQFEAASDEEAAAAVDDLFATAGGAATAEGLDQRLYGEADKVGRGYHMFNEALLGGYDEVIGLVEGGLEMAKGGEFADGYARGTGNVRGAIEKYQQRHPVEATAIGIGGAGLGMLTGGGAIRAGMQALPKVGQAVSKAGNAIGGVGKAAASGTGYGVATGYMHGEGDVTNRLGNAGSGAIIGAATGYGAGKLGQAIGKYKGGKAGRESVPSGTSISAAKTAAYDAAEAAGVAVQPRAVAQFTGTLRQNMQRLNFDPGLHPETAKTIRALERRLAAASQPTQGAHTVFSLSEVENMRRLVLDGLDGAKKKPDRRLLTAMLNQFDGWESRLSGDDFLTSGNVSGQEAIGLFKEGRRLANIAFKNEVLEGLVTKSRKQAIGNRAGFEATLRQNFTTLVSNPGRMRQFSKGEQKALERIAAGGDMGWVLKAIDEYAPKLSLGHTPQNAAWGGLTVAGLPPAVTATAWGAGVAARQGIKRGTKNAARTAGEVIRNEGKVPFDPVAAQEAGDYAARLTNAGAQPSAQKGRPMVLDLGTTFVPGSGGGMIPAR